MASHCTQAAKRPRLALEGTPTPPTLLTTKTTTKGLTTTTLCHHREDPDKLLQRFAEAIRAEIDGLTKKNKAIGTSTRNPEKADSTSTINSRISSKVTSALLECHQRAFDMLTIDFGLVADPVTKPGCKNQCAFMFGRDLDCDDLRSMLWKCQLMRASSPWDVRLEELKQFKLRHGSCDIPEDWEGNPELATCALASVQCVSNSLTVLLR